MWHVIFFYLILAILVTFLGYIIYPIVFPRIIAYPRQNIPDKRENKTVIFAASFNPPHNGHLALLEYLATQYARVVAVIGFNPNKTYPVSPQARAELLEKMIQSALPHSVAQHIEVQVVEGYIWRYAKRIGATIFFRGIRSWDKDGRDERALQILNTWGPLLLGPCIPIPTIYIEGNPKYNHVSSTLIRQICDDEKSKDKAKAGPKTSETGTQVTAALSELVPPSVAATVAKLYASENGII
jgi:pantetheine-phosphate adenylyltransferase